MYLSFSSVPLPIFDYHPFCCLHFLCNINWDFFFRLWYFILFVFLLFFEILNFFFSFSFFSKICTIFPVLVSKILILSNVYHSLLEIITRFSELIYTTGRVETSSSKCERTALWTLLRTAWLMAFLLARHWRDAIAEWFDLGVYLT